MEVSSGDFRVAKQEKERSGGQLHHVVIVGGGFAGLYTTRALASCRVRVTLLDKRNFHLFQPLLYQVATGGLSPGDIAHPLRDIFKGRSNVHVIAGEVVDIEPNKRNIVLRDGVISYDTLVVATGSSHHYFGHEAWKKDAPGLKTVEDALEIRRRIFLAFEAAEREIDPDKRRPWTTFVIVGGGTTGVEMAGSLGELVRNTLKDNFRNIDPSQAEIVLVEADNRILGHYPAHLSAKGERALARLGVAVRRNSLVTEISDGVVKILNFGKTEEVHAKNVIWCAGVKASHLGGILACKCGAELDKAGRILVTRYLTIPNHPEIFVVGDLANFSHQGEKSLPGLAPVAMQQGRFAGRLIQSRLDGKNLLPFFYRDRGYLAVIGRNKAVVDFGFVRFSGFFAWLLWCFIHIAYLIGFDNKLLVLTQWAWNYFTRKRGACLITGETPYPLLKQ